MEYNNIPKVNAQDGIDEITGNSNNYYVTSNENMNEAINSNSNSNNNHNRISSTILETKQITNEDSLNNESVAKNGLINIISESDITNVKPIARTRISTVTRTTTRYIVPTNINNNSDNHSNTSSNSDNNSDENVIQNINDQNLNQETDYSHDNIDEENINDNVSQENSNIPKIFPNANGYGYAATNINIDDTSDSNGKIGDSIQKTQDSTNSKDKNSGGTNSTFIILLITIPLLIIAIVAAVFFIKKYKKRKSERNIVYPDDKIRKSNLFGTLQFWNSNRINRVSVSSDSRNSRTNLTSIISNDNKEESNYPEYSEWLEAGSNTVSPPVSPPPLATDGKVNGLNNPNYAMGVNLNNDLNRNSALNGQINNNKTSKNAWKLEGMRIGRESQSQRKSTRQSLFNSFQVW